MQTIDQKIALIEEEIRKTPYHKGTEHHIGRLRARIAKLKSEAIEKSGGGGGGGYAVSKTGDATVVFVGPPSVGKSTLLNRLTNAQSKVGEYDFTTQEVIPGMMEYKGARIQLFDIPGIIEGAAKGKGRGKQVLSVARVANLIAIVVDVKTTDKIEMIKKELYDCGIRLGEPPPRVTIVKQPSGGIKVNSTTILDLSYETIKSLASEFHLANAEITIKENISLDQLIDVFLNNRVYLPYIIVVNKYDLGITSLPFSCKEALFISAENGFNLDKLKEKIWQELLLIRVYLKKEEIADYNSPFILRKGESLKNLLANISICNKHTFTRAKVYGKGAKYPGQEVSLNFIPQDETIVQFI